MLNPKLANHDVRWMSHTVSSQVAPSPASPVTPHPLTSFRLSVMVPVYNEKHVVEASLKRVLALNHALISSLEVIVVDGCTTAGPGAILHRLAAADSRIVLLRNDRNLGKGAALRKAIAHSTGEI